MVRGFWQRSWVGLVLGGLSCEALAAEVSVAVAANFSAPMQAIAAQFERDTGHQVRLSIGATGQFYAQIRHGAPFHVLLAADDKTPEKLQSEGLAAPGSRFTYALGKLVLWSRQPGVVDPRGEVLRRGAFDKIATANPKLSPYGAAALAAIQRMGVTDQVSPKRVEGSHIGQAHQFVASGNATLGFVALSQVLQDGRIAQGSAWVVPASMYPPIRQDAVLLNPGKGHEAATALLRYLQGEPARAVIRAHGYDLP